MKCPKCQYISFDSGDRCRNCGYDFGLAPGPNAVDVTLQRDAWEGQVPDLDLRPASAPTPAGSRRRSAGPALDLPLFHEPVPGLDDTPLIGTPSPPRPPLAVRRSTPDPGRGARGGRVRGASTTAGPDARSPGRLGDEESPAPARSGRAEGATTAGGLDAGLAARAGRAVPQSAGAAVSTGLQSMESATAEAERPAALPVAGGGTAAGDGRRAALPRRLVAGAVDLALVLGIDLAVVHFTLAVVRYPWSRVGDLPLLPLAGFCLLLNAGYLVLFTAASGQTIGGMLAGVRVVTDSGTRVALGQAALRTLLLAVSVLPAGLGLLPALVTGDGRTVHDRLSGTRVVRA